jgi:hypothetical protein
MTRGWMLTLATGGVTMGMKMIGALIASPRPMLRPFHSVVDHITPALLPIVLTALIVMQTFGNGTRLTLDARAAGLAAAILAACIRARPVVVVIVAASTTALVRLASA